MKSLDMKESQEAQDSADCHVSVVDRKWLKRKKLNQFMKSLFIFMAVGFEL